MATRRLSVDLLLLALLLGSAGLNVFQARGGVLRANTRASFAAVGTQLPSFAAKDASGTDVTIDFQESSVPTVLYVFSKHCGFCEENQAAFDKLVSGAGERFRFIAIERDARPGLPTLHTGSLPLYWQPDNETRRAFGLMVIPQTLVLSAEGKLLKDFHGAYMGSVRDDVANYFGVNLASVPSAGRATGSGKLCYDRQGGVHSEGAILAMNGQSFECAEEGKWTIQ